MLSQGQYISFFVVLMSQCLSSVITVYEFWRKNVCRIIENNGQCYLPFLSFDVLNCWYILVLLLLYHFSNTFLILDTPMTLNLWSTQGYIKIKTQKYLLPL